MKVREIIGCMKDMYLLDENGIYYTIYMDTEATIRLSDPIPLVSEWAKVIHTDIEKIDRDKLRKHFYVIDDSGVYYLASKNGRELPSKSAPVLRGNTERMKIFHSIEEEMKNTSGQFGRKIINLDTSIGNTTEFSWLEQDIKKEFDNGGIHDKLLISARLYGSLWEYRFWKLAFYFIGTHKTGRITPLAESAASTRTSSTLRNANKPDPPQKPQRGQNTKSSNSIKRKSSTPDSMIATNYSEKDVTKYKNKPRRLRGSCENLLKLAVDTSNLLSISIDINKEEISSYLYYSQDSKKLSSIEKDLQNLIGGSYTRRNSSFIDKQLSSVLNSCSKIKQLHKPNTLKFISGIPKGKVFEEILRENELQACFLLQVLGYCEEAAIISKISLNQVQSLKIYLKWAIELIYKGFPLQAVELLMSSGQYHRVLQVLTKEKMYGQAMLFYVYCQTKGIIAQNQWAYHVSAIFDVPLWEEISSMFNTISEFHFTPERLERSLAYLSQEYANCANEK